MKYVLIILFSFALSCTKDPGLNKSKTESFYTSKDNVWEYYSNSPNPTGTSLFHDTYRIGKDSTMEVSLLRNGKIESTATLTYTELLYHRVITYNNSTDKKEIKGRAGWFRYDPETHTLFTPKYSATIDGIVDEHRLQFDEYQNDTFDIPIHKHSTSSSSSSRKFVFDEGKTINFNGLKLFQFDARSTDWSPGNYHKITEGVTIIACNITEEVNAPFSSNFGNPFHLQKFTYKGEVFRLER